MRVDEITKASIKQEYIMTKRDGKPERPNRKALLAGATHRRGADLSQWAELLAADSGAALATQEN